MSEDIGLNHSDKGGQSAVKEPVSLPAGEGPFLSEQDKQASVASPFLPLFARRVPGKAVFFRNTLRFPDGLSGQAITQAFTDQQGSGRDQQQQSQHLFHGLLPLGSRRVMPSRLFKSRKVSSIFMRAW